MRATPNDTTQPKEILFIEGNVSDYQTLLNAAQPDIEIHLLDANQDGLAQIAQILAGRSGIDALHIVSHGSAGTLNLGATQLSTQNLPAYSATLSAIGSTLSPGADILLYGCDVAQGSAGAALIEALAQATQADIAASTDRTGAAALGGNWVLEALARTSTTNGIQTPLAFDAAAVQGWNQTLDANNRYIFASISTDPTQNTGSELWVSDGTAAGTKLLKDIYTGAISSVPNGFTLLSPGKAIFQANNATSGQEVWITDGTAAGTILLKDINPDTGYSSPIGFTPIVIKTIENGVEVPHYFAIFQANNGSNGFELWITDGTKDGTKELNNIYGGATSSYPYEFTSLGDGKFVFYANDSSDGQELRYVTINSDGTLNSSKTLTIVSDFYDSTPRGLTLLNTNTVLFSADDSTPFVNVDGKLERGVNREPWKIDFSVSSSPSKISEIRSTTTFGVDHTYTDAETGKTTTITAPTSSSLQGGSDGSGSNPKEFTPLGNGRAVFSADSTVSAGVQHTDALKTTALPAVTEYIGNGRELWITDGNSAWSIDIYGDPQSSFTTAPDGDTYKSTLPNSSNPSGFILIDNGKVLFSANNGSNGRELWFTDGTEVGTYLLKDINSGASNSDSNPSGFTPLGNGRALFSATDSSNFTGLWITDGTSVGTTLLPLKDATGAVIGSNPVGITRINNGQALFSASNKTGGYGFWITDGTSANTRLITDVGAPIYSFMELDNAISVPTMTLVLASASITEDNSGSKELVFTVNLSNASSSKITVDYTTANGTASASSDYIATTGTLGFAPGEISKSIFVPIIGDSHVEGDETFTLTLSSPSGAILGGSAFSAEATIVNDDIPGITLALTSNDPSKDNKEGDSDIKSVSFTVTLSEAAASQITVDYATANETGSGKASAGSDYTDTKGTIGFAPGEKSKVVLVPIFGDTQIESDETFTLKLSNPQGATLDSSNSVEATIYNDDKLAFTISPTTNASINEGDSGSKQLSFTVNLSAAATGPVTVNYATANGTASAESDYKTTSGTLTFAPGASLSQTILVPVLGDLNLENDETFTITLSNPSSGTDLGSVFSATATIINDDIPVVTISPTSSSSITEGNSGSQQLSFNVNLANASTSKVTLSYDTANGTATAGSDYTATSGTIDFAPGETRKTISVPILGDTTIEGDETFTLKLSNPSGALPAGSIASATATIVNDDVPVVTLSPVFSTSITEGNSGSNKQLDFLVSLSNASYSRVSVSYATANGTASAGSDYVETNGTIGFAPGETSKTISVPIVGDAVVEGDETFSLALSDPKGATLDSVASVNATIVNDDVPVVTIFGSSTTEGDSGSKELSFTVNLSIAASSPITVDYATANGTDPNKDAQAGSDYTSVSGTVGFAPGEKSKTISVPILGDKTVEGDETFTLTISKPSGAMLNPDISVTATATILNDDTLVTISPASNTITEGDSGSQNLSFTVSLSSANTSTVTVKYATADGSASAGSDYTNPNTITNGTLTFLPGVINGIINVPILGDTNVEDNETFTVTLSSPTNAVLGSVASATATIVNNDNSGVSIFSSTDKTYGSELWATDSTGTGTALLKDINPGSSNSTPSGFTPLTNGKAIFQANDGSNGAELWITDGTLTGTVLLKNIYEGPNGSTPDGFTPLGNGKVLFRANDGNNGTEPWITDGTSAGTKLIKNIASAASSSSNPTGFISVGDGKAIFQASDGSNGTELWITDGTDAGTTQLKDIYAGANGSGPSGFTALGNGRFIFSANDGTKGGELWVTDGTGTGTKLVKDIYKDANGSSPSGFTALGNGKALFNANDGSNGNELWITDGTETGTKLLKDIYSGSSSANPGGFSPFGKDNKFLFQATDGGNGTELWITDGTEAGTALLKDIYPGANNSSQPGVIGLFTPLGNGKTLFSATNGSNGFELWITDGTSSGTSLVKDIYAGANNTNPAISSNPVGMTPLGNGKAIFSAATKQDTYDQLVYGLWITDGTSAGTQLVKDISGIEPIQTFAKLTNTSGTAPNINLSPISPAIIEGNSGSQQLDFLVSLSAAASSAVTVNYATANGTDNDKAIAGSDYTALSGSLTFAPGETSKTISVAITGDTTPESDEKFTLTLSNPSGGTLGNASTTAMIMNDDGSGAASSAAVPGTLGNDFLLPSAAANYLGGGGNDTYIISAKTLSSAVTAKITDTEGTNVIQLVDGLAIASSSFLSNSVQLTLSNGASVQILGASGFSYLVGANAPAGDTASSQTYATFAATLGASVPADSTAVSGTSYTVPSGVTPASTPTPGTATTPSTVPGTLGNDFFLPSGGNNYFGGGGNDTYIISPYTLNGSVTAKIVDTEGANVVQLVDGLVIASSSFYNNAVQLTLSNGASVQILGAAAFSYQVGANAPSGDTASSQTYAQFASTLGGSVPAAGAAAVSGTANYPVPTGSAAIQMPDTEGSSGNSIPVVGLVGLDGLVGFDAAWW